MKTMAMEDSLTIYPADNIQWREWLVLNHSECKGIWLVYNKKVRGKELPGLSWSEAVDTALCFGWSGVNKQKVENLIDLGLMANAGCRRKAHHA